MLVGSQLSGPFLPSPPSLPSSLPLSLAGQEEVRSLRSRLSLAAAETTTGWKRQKVRREGGKEGGRIGSRKGE